MRTEATGFGCVYFVERMLTHSGDALDGKTVVVSGSGNVATYAAEKAVDLGATVVTLSDSGGYIYDPAGMDKERLDFVKDLKEVRRGRISEYADRFGCAYREGEQPWDVPCDVALPCATQNELDEAAARSLIANMPCSLAATRAFLAAGVLFGPAKAANAGGVAVSGLEQSQNALRMSWSHDEVHPHRDPS